MAESTLWFATGEQRFFLIPETAVIADAAEGLAIRTLTGIERTVPAGALAAYEVSGHDAQAHVVAQVKGFLGNAFTSVARAANEGGDALGVAEDVQTATHSMVGNLEELQKMFGEFAENFEEPDENLHVPPEDIASGLRFTHVVEMETKHRVSDLAAEVAALRALLVEKGVVETEALRKYETVARTEELRRLTKDVLVVLNDTPDKYAVEPVIIDCKERIPLCKARCCTFTFALATQDLDERIVRWDYGRPYQIGRRGDGYCVHNEEEPGEEHRLCTIHEVRPASCRTYDCRNDKRIWIDFDKKLPA